MKRRDFVRQSVGWAGLGLWSAAGLRGQASPPASAAPVSAAPAATFTPVREGVGYFSGRGGTIGWLVSDDGVVAVDTQFPDTAEQFVQGLPGRHGRPFNFVINTHHHGDHTSGNAVLRRATATVLAHQHVPELMRAAAARSQREVDPALLPNSVTAGATTLGVGSERLRLDYLGAAHTKGDLVVTFERANVVHVGDLLFNRLYPVIDRPGGASIRNWIKVLETLHGRHEADAIFLFGHGNPRFGVTGRRADLLVFRDYLTGLLEHVGAQITAGRSREEIVGLENLPGFADFHQPLPNRLGSNLGVAYDELTAGDAA